jgi:hypothetical protein
MGQRVYTAFFDQVSIAAVQDALSLKAGAANGIELHHIMLTANGVTSPAEIRLLLKRATGTATQGTGGSTPTAIAVDDGDTKASAATVHANDVTTQMTGSVATQTLMPWNWNVLLPFEYLPAPEDRELCQAGEGFALNVPAAPVSTLVSGFIKWRELP